MVWFQCEVCGENLKKPKLPNHFRICSAHKLSCIDCGDLFSKESVQSHTQCITEAEKYGPKDHGKPMQKSGGKPEKAKKNADVDVNVGLSSHPPWFCSLCNTPATSKQTLMLHADGKKHRAKAKAFNQSNHAEETEDNDKVNGVATPKLEPVKTTASSVDELEKNDLSDHGAEQSVEKFFDKKRKLDVVEIMPINSCESKDSCEEKSQSKRCKNEEKILNSECAVDGAALKKKINWKKLIISALKSKPEGAMKIKKLKKLVINELKKSGIDGDEVQLCDAMMEKINSSSKFVIDSKHISLASKIEKSQSTERIVI